MAATSHSTGEGTDPETETTDEKVLSDRQKRALTEYISICPDTDQAEDAENQVMGHSESGNSYIIDTLLRVCWCLDFEHNCDKDDEDKPNVCKHLLREQYATGKKPIPMWAAKKYDIDPQLGKHIEGTVKIVEGGEVIGTGQCYQQAADRAGITV